MSDTTTTEPTVSIETVTPDEAKAILENNVNRRKRPKDIAKYARDMAAGRWDLNGESIKIDTDGVLRDGQHRLEACILADAPFRTTVVRGVAPSTQDTMDSGIKRKFTDQLDRAGEKNARTLAAIIARVNTWEETGRYVGNTAYKASNAELFATLEAHPELREATEVAQRVRRQLPIAPSVVGFAWWMFSQLDRQDADWFFEHLASGAHLGSDHPILLLRNQVVRTHRDVRGQRNEYVMCGLTVKAWNAFRDGARPKLLRFNPGGALAEPFPQPR